MLCEATREVLSILPSIATFSAKVFIIGAQDLPPKEPWRAIPPELGELLRPHLPALSDEVIEAIREQVPAYSRPLRGRFGTGIRLGVEEALAQFVELIADPELDRSAAERVYRGLGRGEYRERRSLDALLAAYRLGARVSWRRVAALAIEARVDARTLATLAEAVFAYIDGISALSVEGYAAEQSAAAGAAQRRRRRLARLLLEAEPDLDEVGLAAAEADWKLPASLAVVVWLGEGGRLRARLPLEALVIEDEEAGEGGLALLPDPGSPGLRERLERAAQNALAVVGPAVPVSAAASSAARAQRLLALIDGGVLAAGGLVDSDEHLAALITHGEPGALRDLAARRFAPLEPESAGSRARLLRTLRSWLDHQGEVAAVAAELHVHPQTVRYRLARLRERFGAALDQPAARYELALALRAPGLSAGGDGKTTRA